MFTNYTDVRDWLESFIPQTYTKKELGLGRIRHLLKLLGNPQDKFKSIHIAGTSGKGSAAYYTARLLQESKSKRVKVGLHLSPHLVDIRERMQIFSSFRYPGVATATIGSRDSIASLQNDSLIPMRRFIRVMSEIKPVVDSMRGSKAGLPSYFEIIVAASLLYFAQEKVDIAVVEVGLGGRLDATNVLNPEVSVITNVGFDHTDILGKSIEKIAFEKAGIIKETKGQRGGESKSVKGVTVLTGAMGKALEVIKKVAKEKKALLITKSTLSKAFREKSELFRYKKLYKKLFNNSFPFVTEETFLLSCATVASLGISLNEAKISEAFKSPFAGRFELIDENVVIDGAHNLEKIKVLVRWIKKHLTADNLQLTANKKNKSDVKGQLSIVLIVAFKKGKNWWELVDYLFRNLDIERCIATQFYSVTDMGFFSSVDPEEIADYVQRQGSSLTSVYSNSHEAVFDALSSTRGVKSKQTPRVRSAVVLVTGSLYLVGEARTIWYMPEFVT